MQETEKLWKIMQIFSQETFFQQYLINYGKLNYQCSLNIPIAGL